MTKLSNGNRWTLATLAATLMVSGVAFAQQATTADPYSGVSQPPPDSTIAVVMATFLPLKSFHLLG